MRAIRRMGLWLGIGILGLVAAAGMAAADEIQLPPGPNRELVYGACRTCHDLGYLVESAGIGREDWDSLINGMRQYGLRIPPAERAKILDYLGTYLGPHPPPAGAATAAAAPEAVDGSKIFATQCTACHQPDGKGLPGHFPPLAGNHDLFRDRLLPVYVLLNGLSGPIAVEGNSYNGQMPSFAHLSDAEIAAVIRYVRDTLNKEISRPAGMAPIDAETVKQARAKPLDPAAVHAYRAGLP